MSNALFLANVFVYFLCLHLKKQKNSCSLHKKSIYSSIALLISLSLQMLSSLMQCVVYELCFLFCKKLPHYAQTSYIFAFACFIFTISWNKVSSTFDKSGNLKYCFFQTFQNSLLYIPCRRFLFCRVVFLNGRFLVMLHFYIPIWFTVFLLASLHLNAILLFYCYFTIMWLLECRRLWLSTNTYLATFAFSLSHIFTVWQYIHTSSLGTWLAPFPLTLTAIVY